MKVVGDRIFLKLLLPEDVGENYVKWMEDEEVTRFLESRFKRYSLEDLKEYVRNMKESPSDFLFGIFLKENNKHIGNIKISGVDQIHKFGDIGLLIGEKSEWGKGYGTEAIKLITKYSFEQLNLHKLITGIYENNISSLKAFSQAGYKEVGRYKKHRFFNGEYIDEILLERCRDD